MNELIEATATDIVEPVRPETYIDKFRDCYKLAQVICQANTIPDAYKNKAADCAIAIDMANRMNVAPLFVMQNLYVVKGKPSWSGQACTALINACGKFSDVQHLYFGQPDTDGRGCRVVAKHADTGELIEGPAVTMAMAKAEGWTSNPKWRNMPELMLAYRAASFFARVHCPQALMGLQTEGESEDSVKTKRTAEDVL